MPALKSKRYSPFSLSGMAYLSVRSPYRYFVTGASVTGRPTDNASFLHPATEDHRGKPVERLSGPLWQRLARRWALLGGPLLLTLFALVSTVVRWFADALALTPPPFFRVPWFHLAVGWELAAVVAVLILSGSAFVSWWRQRKKISEFVYPAWQAACSHMGTVYRKREARRMVELPEGFEVTDARAAGVPGAWGRLADRLWRDRRNTAALTRAAREAEQAVEGGTDDPPGTVVAERRSTVIARYLGRRVIPESVVPVEAPEPPPVRVRLFPGKVTTDAQRKQFSAAVGNVLGMPDVRATWYPKGRAPFVELRPNLAPPVSVSFAQVVKHLDRAPLTAPFMGLAAGNHPVSIDLDNNSPHTMISGGSGTGKSVLLRNFLAQRMHNGAGVLMLDYKRVSHRWLHNLPGCDYAWRLEDIHTKLCAAGEELGRRLETVLPADNDITAEMRTFPTIDVVVEEINSTTKLLDAYWKTVLGGSGTSPAVTALMTLTNMGREYRMHMWIAAQRASASVFGSNGGDLRESFQTRLLAKWSVQTWKMLAGNAVYRRPIGGRGVWARVQDDEVEIVRVPFWTNPEARAYAMSGTACPDVVLPHAGQVLTGRPPTTAPDVGPQLVTLSAALTHLPPDNRGNYLGVSGMRTASKRPGFPAPRIIDGPGRPSLYDLDELIAWRVQQVGEVGELVELFEQPAAPSELRRPGIVYACDTLNPTSGAVEVGYVGQTRRTLLEREAEHRGDKPWADLIVGSFRVIWTGEPTDAELDAIERQHIRRLLPRYNVEHQKGAVHAVPKWEQVDQRHARDAEKGLKPWVPIDVYNGQTRPELIEEWRREA